METPRGSHWNTETVYIHNKVLTLQNSQSNINSLDKHHKKTDNIMLQMGGMKGWSTEEATLPNNQVICFLAHLCHPNSAQAVPPESIPGHSAMSEYGISGISVWHCWQGASCRGTNWNPVLSLASHRLAPDGLSWQKQKTWNHLEEVVTHRCCPTPVSKQELMDYGPLSEYGAWEPNPPPSPAKSTGFLHKQLT